MTQQEKNPIVTVSGNDKFTAAAGQTVLADDHSEVVAEAGSRCDGWEEAVIRAHAGSNVCAWSAGVTIHAEPGARVSNRGGGTVIPVETAGQ